MSLEHPILSDRSQVSETKIESLRPRKCSPELWLLFTDTLALRFLVAKRSTKLQLTDCIWLLNKETP